MLSLVFLLAHQLVDPLQAAYCGTSAIPFSFEVLPDGGTVLGCARPDCFGWDPSTGGVAVQDQSFGQVDGRIDGYLRQGPQQQPPFQMTQPQTSICIGAGSCTADQWVGGFNRLPDGSMTMICCSYAPLAQSTSQGEAPLQRGEIYSGGEMPGRMFDYISNVRPIAGADGQVSHYSLDVKRMACPQPIPLSIPEAGAGANNLIAQAVPQSLPAPEVQPIVPPANYIPVDQASAAAAAASSTSYYCFAADSTVKLPYGAKSKRMDELELTDHVYCPTQNFSGIRTIPINGWLHKMPEENVEFIVLATSTGKKLKLTEKHLIYRSECGNNSILKPEIITANQMSIGDCVLEITEEELLSPVMIQKIGRVIQRGYYAPLTDNGMIIVDGIAASCYAEESGNILMQTIRESSLGVVSCSDDSAFCEVSHYGASLLLDMMELVSPF